MVGCITVALLASLAEYLLLRFLLSISNLFDLWDAAGVKVRGGI